MRRADTVALLIGTACGFFIGTLFTMLWAVNITAPGRKPSALFGSLNRVPGTIPASALLPLVVMGAWGLGGGMIGALYIGAEALAPGSGIGSPNMAFSIGICVFTLNAVVLGALWTRKWIWRDGYLLGVAFAGMFGWLMPLLLS